MKNLLIASVLTGVLLSHFSTDTATIRVPADCTTFQGAINTAIDADAVPIAPRNLLRQ
jgi:hypothetical protein